MADLDSGRVTFLERRMLVAIRAVLLTVALTIQFGVYGYRFVAGQFRAPAEVGVYAVLAVTSLAWAAVLLVRGRTPTPIVFAGTAVLLACSLTMALVLPLDALQRAEHWSFSVIGWHALALLFEVPLWWFAGFCAVHVTALTWPLVASGATLPDLAAMAVVVVAVVGFQLGVAMSAMLVRAIATASARTSREEERLRIRNESAAAAASNRARRYAELRVSTIPLLAGLAGGDLDPRDPEVRRRCAVDAARMRRLFCETEAVDDRLVHELGAVIDIAERHGASVHLSVRGTPMDLTPSVRHELLTPVSEALVAAGSEARVTVLYTADRVRLSVLCAAPVLPSVRTGAGQVALVESVVRGRLRLETSWQSR
ncbi:hypothetical protein [Actinophytocola sp. NPDC049390]|uniref:hypothetical protein n=1 Tax=Actinophytocola sp. NPDC049390 TaxID=3363894 RepID=UPI0037879937